ERIRWEKQNPEDQERLAEDFTFSAPKSVAIALHLNRDHRLHAAHLEAVKETLDLIEERYATTRIQSDGVRNLVHTGNLTIALINHHTSRSKDMQLHTHAVIMNGTQGPDGKWRSLQNDAMSEHGAMGHIYRQKLALKVQALGYRIYETKDAFELEGLSREDIEVFSKRTAAIARELERQGLEATSENKARAVLTSRRAKDRTQTLEELQQSWRAEAEVSGIESPQPKPVAVTPLRLGTARAELDSAVAHLSERTAAFSREDLYRTVFSHIQAFEVTDLDREITQHPELVRTQDARLTTVAALEREIATVREWFNGQGQAQAIATYEKAMSELKGTGLNAGQAEAIAGVLAATDQHLILHGLSGVGKTTALRELKHQIEQSGQAIEIKGFSPTIEAAEVLKASLGVETYTVESLVRKPIDKVTPHKQLWIVDEAGMVGADQQLTMLQKGNAVGARILLVGDPKQNPSVKAGGPMRSLIAHGATTFRIADIIRQQNAVQKKAVELIANDRPQDALSLLVEHDYVQEIDDRSQRVNVIAQDYLALNEKERSQTLIVTGTNAERKAIVAEIRAGLRAEGLLGEDYEVTQLTGRYLTQEQKRRIENYRQGDYIQLLRGYRSTALQSRKLYRVMGRSENELVVASEGGRLYRFDPSKYAEKE
ncbi:MAG TPA: MobF family relaxase, partial [Stenomitos sp.]